MTVDLPAPAAAVIYAKSLDALTAFYASLPGFSIAHCAGDHTALVSTSLELTIVNVPAHIASTFAIASPPEKRSDAAIKLAFAVPDLAAVRAVVNANGGSMNAVEGEWQYGELRVCDGCDPEGNVVQFRERRPPDQ